MSSFDINNFKTLNRQKDRYAKGIAALRSSGKQTDCIEKAVDGAMRNIKKNETRSFVIYGEPQSGKTEMMISLTAKLLDEGFKIIIHLLNDSVDLLGQNLRRFKMSGLSPSPKAFTEILDTAIEVRDREMVLFCKKNSNDLQKLISRIGSIDEKIIIDDEADYASPNAKVNKGEKTRINSLIESLLGNSGIYIGVTATPARLDLNNTFENDHEKWIDFPPHNKYAGQDVFFPIDTDDPFGYTLTFLKDTDDSPKYIKEALFRFLVNVAFLNLQRNKTEVNYGMLIHTSGKRIDHRDDRIVVETILNELNDEMGSKYIKHVKEIWETSKSIYPGFEEKLTAYVVSNKNRFDIVLLNSDRHNPNLDDASNPVSLFTIIIGGNIVSRGVTFNNLLSMFFTRDVRHKIQQDTYIQRARMFGSRGDYLKYFELTIPELLYTDWHRCFVFHRLAISAIKDGKGAPVWLSDNRISPVSSSSIDRSTVSLDKGEMSFTLFNITKTTIDNYDTLADPNVESFVALNKIQQLLGEDAFPNYLVRYIRSTSFNQPQTIAIHPSSSIKDMGADTNKERIERTKGFMGTPQLQRTLYPHATHHVKLFHNGKGKARLFYKFDGSIQFIKNLIQTIEGQES